MRGHLEDRGKNVWRAKVYAGRQSDGRRGTKLAPSTAQSVLPKTGLPNYYSKRVAATR